MTAKALLAAIAAAPNGLTARQVAKKFSVYSRLAAARLSYLHARGKLAREVVRGRGHAPGPGHRWTFRYRVQP